jgi:hypothetical protein
MTSAASQRARLAAYSLRAQRDPREYTAAARSAAFARFLDLVDPERELPEGERVARAEAARRAHMIRAALKSAETRKRKAAASPHEATALEVDRATDQTDPRAA